MKSALRKILYRYRYQTPPPTLKVLYDGKEVAELKRERSGSYHFRYLDAFKEMNLEPLPGLALDREYGGSELPLYFRERMPDVKRADVQKVIEKIGISIDDDLLLLATLGKHTITDPFEFQLTAA